jgi:hypothetical protein
MTARSRPLTRRLAASSALAALTAVLALPGAAHALDAPAPPPDEIPPAVTAAEPTSTTTTTTVAPAASPDATDAPSSAPETAPAAAEVRAAVTGPASVDASPTTGLNPAGATISVRGSGFDPNANNGFGIYVVFGPVDPGTYFKDANRFLAAMWLHPGGAASGSPGQGDLRADGTFSTTLPAPNGAALTATYTDGNGTPVSCLTAQCYVVTIAAHGVGDRSMDTCTPVSFAGGTAIPAVDRACRPVSTPAARPTASGTPDGSGGADDPGGATTGGSDGATGAGSGGSGGASTLPRTGPAAPGRAAAAGVLTLVSGLALVQGDRRRRAKSRPAPAAGPPDCTG